MLYASVLTSHKSHAVHAGNYLTTAAGETHYYRVFETLCGSPTKFACLAALTSQGSLLCATAAYARLHLHNIRGNNFKYV